MVPTLTRTVGRGKARPDRTGSLSYTLVLDIACRLGTMAGPADFELMWWGMARPGRGMRGRCAGRGVGEEVTTTTQL